MLGSWLGSLGSPQCGHQPAEPVLGSISGVLRQTAQEGRSLEKNRKSPNPNKHGRKAKKKKKSFCFLVYNVENLENAPRFVKQNIPAVTLRARPGGSARAVAPAVLCFGESFASGVSSRAGAYCSFTGQSSGVYQYTRILV